MMTEKTKVARNKPSVTRVIRERMKIRTVLGEYWLAASWMATSVVANTTATNARVAAAMAPAKVAALPGSLTRFWPYANRSVDLGVEPDSEIGGDDRGDREDGRQEP